jgi:hypothetical protein
MRAQILAVLLGGAGAFGVVGCGESKSDGAGDRDQFIAQLCAEFSGCCKAAGRPSDGAQCRAFYGAFAPATGYDQTAATACLDEVKAVGSVCDANSLDSPSCGKVFAGSGTKKPGETCEDDNDCAPAESGRVECASEYVNGANIQQCQVRLPGTAGSTPCVGTRDGNITFYSGVSDAIPTTGYVCDVADGLSCDSQSGACKSLGAVGAACTGSSYQCVAAAYCSFTENQCKARLALGAACEDDDECAATAFCEPTGNTCAARHAIAAVCANNAECESDNCTNLKCGAKDDLTLAFLCGSN